MTAIDKRQQEDKNRLTQRREGIEYVYTDDVYKCIHIKVSRVWTVIVCEIEKLQIGPNLQQREATPEPE